MCIVNPANVRTAKANVVIHSICRLMTNSSRRAFIFNAVVIDTAVQVRPAHSQSAGPIREGRDMPSLALAKSSQSARQSPHEGGSP
jgi:hypothetical protein